MAIFRKRSLILLCSAFLLLAVIANAAIGAGAAYAAPSRAHAAADAPAARVNVASLLAQARALANARFSSERLSPAKNKPRIGWFIPVDCYCRMADELTFQQDLQLIVFNVAAPLDHMQVRVQPNTYMKLSMSARHSRVPDIYYFRLNKKRPALGAGYLNELKVGTVGMDPRRWPGEASDDNALYLQGHGFGSNKYDRGEYLPVTAALWWFAPDASGVTYYDPHVLAHLLSLGINIVYMVQVDTAPPWPRKKDKKQVAKDTKEIENNDEATALVGLDDLMAPCPPAASCPLP